MAPDQVVLKLTNRVGIDAGFREGAKPRVDAINIGSAIPGRRQCIDLYPGAGHAFTERDGFGAIAVAVVLEALCG